MQFRVFTKPPFVRCFSLFYTRVLFSIAFEADRRSRISESAQPERTTLALSDVQGTGEGEDNRLKSDGKFDREILQKESQGMRLDDGSMVV